MSKLPWIFAASLLSLAACGSTTPSVSAGDGDAGTNESDSGTGDGASAGDGGSAMDGGVELPAVTICAPSSTTGTAGAGSSFAYACTPCAGDFTTCSYAAPGQYPTYTRPSDATTRTLKAVDYVVDSMAGTLVYSDDGTSHTVLLHAGEGGVGFSKSAQISHYLLPTTQANVVHVVWMPGATNVFGSAPAGWWTRKSATPVDVPTQVARPAAVIRWAHDHLVFPGKSFGTVGCSLGTMATLGSVLWKNLDGLVSYQWVGGGSAFWDVNASCGRSAVPYPAGGHCDSDGRACTNHCDCSQGCPATGGGYDVSQAGGHEWDWCRMPTDTTTTNFPALVNYLSGPAAGGGPTCLTTTEPPTSLGSPLASLDVSSFRTNPPASWELGHVVDFAVEEDGDATSRPVDQGVLEGATGFVFEAIQKANAAAGKPAPAWNDYQPNNHCDYFEGDPSFTDVTAKLVATRMGL